MCTWKEKENMEEDSGQFIVVRTPNRDLQNIFDIHVGLINDIAGCVNKNHREAQKIDSDRSASWMMRGRGIRFDNSSEIRNHEV